MNRNTETRFSRNPATTDIDRSGMPRPFSHTTTFNAGDLIPIYYDEVLASDTHRLSMGSVIRSQTPVHPVFDDAYCDAFFFFVPFRLVWDHWINFMGENTDSAWVSDVTYTPPKLPADSSGFANKSIADYFGFATGVSFPDGEIDAMRFRGYRLIYNEWFRSEALQDPLLVNTGDVESDPTIYGDVLKACKPFDMFTSCLPAPQRGDSVTLPLIGDAPLYTGVQYPDSGDPDAPDRSFHLMAPFGFDNRVHLTIGNLGFNMDGDALPVGVDTTDATATQTSGVKFVDTYADMSKVSSATINQLRQAFAVQRLLEADARGGGRYRSLLRTHFGASVPDSTVQVPEYLGGYRQNLRTQEVLQTSGTTSTNLTPQGNVAAFSKTVQKGFVFEKSFTEPGMIIGLCCIRHNHTYQQGWFRDATRKSRYDYYWPELAHIGEVPVLNKEIYVDDDTVNTGVYNQVFGYQEPWYDYRYKMSYVSGEMRSNVSETLDSWHYADEYDGQPYLSSEWVKSTSAFIDRTLAVQSGVSDQFFANFYFDLFSYRPMPLYSVPGLTGHY